MATRHKSVKPDSKMISSIAEEVRVTEEFSQLLEHYLQQPPHESDKRISGIRDGQYVCMTDRNQNPLGHYVDIDDGTGHNMSSGQQTNMQTEHYESEKFKQKKDPLFKRIQASFRHKKKSSTSLLNTDNQLVENADTTKEVVDEKHGAKKNWFKAMFLAKKSDKNGDSAAKLDSEDKPKGSGVAAGLGKRFHSTRVMRSKSLKNSSGESSTVRSFSKKDEKYFEKVTGDYMDSSSSVSSSQEWNNRTGARAACLDLPKRSSATLPSSNIPNRVCGMAASGPPVNRQETQDLQEDGFDDVDSGRSPEFDTSKPWDQKSPPEKDQLLEEIVQVLRKIGDEQNTLAKLPVSTDPIQILYDQTIGYVHGVTSKVSYEDFQKIVDNEVGDKIVGVQICALFGMTKYIVQKFGAIVIKEFTMKYFKEELATKVVEGGGLDAVVDKSNF